MKQMGLFVDERSPFEKLSSLEYLEKGFKAVKNNGGAAGIDGVTTEDFGSRLIKRINNNWYMGWSGYYRITQYPSQLRKIEAHIRRRIRARLVDQQKRRRYLFEKLVKRNVPLRLAAKTVYSNRGRCALSHSRAVELAFPNRWFIKEMGLKIRSDEKHSHWFGLNQWIKVT